MTPDEAVVRAEITLALEPQAAFDTLIDELTLHLARFGLQFDAEPTGRVIEGDVTVGRVTLWNPGSGLRLEWRPASWEPEKTTEIELRVQPAGKATRVIFEHRGIGALLGDAPEAAGWFAGQVIAPVMHAVAPRAFGDWLTDRRARRPSGAQARAIYRDPLYHRPNFRAILEVLALEARDYLVEVGCGGGAFLADALKSGCRAAAVDHSADMVSLAREVNRETVGVGRLTIEQASAEHLPFPDATFTCGVMTGVFGFLPDPVAALAELRRVLAAGGRAVIMGTDPAWRGTPAAPEPIASRLQFFGDEQLEAIARQAGFTDVRVVRIPLDRFAREAGVPAEHLPLFEGPGAPFLLAQK